ncbi:MAG: TetR/AcrR family transcriptional regulator [Bacteroidia bacterium]|nr:TetR/AcrR family transcriptional regulator [Bacteroidia bacterium]
MEPAFKITINEKLYVKDPNVSELGKKIVKHGLDLILELGFEQFTFKKLAAEIGTTEASVYRYFENKHRLLTYLINWYWTYLEYKILFHTKNLGHPEIKLKKVIELLSEDPKDSGRGDELSEKSAYELLMLEGSKAYLTRHVNRDNKAKFFKPYKDLCADFSAMIREYNPNYPFSHSLASTLLEMAHSQKYFMNYLPSLTDFGNEKTNAKLRVFLEHLLFQAIRKTKKA